LSDDGSIFWQLLFQLFLILVNAIFASAEIAVLSTNENKIARLSAEGDKRASKLNNLTNQPARFLATIQVGITLAGFLASAFAADNFSDRIVHRLLELGVKMPQATLNNIVVVLITLLLSYFMLVFGELVPKRIAMRNAEKLSLGLSGMLYGLSKIFFPLVALLTVSTNGVLRLLGIDPEAADNNISEEEIRMMVDEGTEKGAVTHTEKEMIQNVFEFDDKTAEEVMTHRTEVVVLWLDETPEQWDETITESRHTIYPVCDETMDNVIGILNIKDYYRLKDKSKDSVLKNAVKPAYFVPETVKTDVLFRNMKATRNHFAIVLDEYGGMNGIITMNDLLEQLVGDLGDDHPEVEIEPEIERIDSRTWKILGFVPLERVSEQLGVLLPVDDFETFGGFVFGELGYVPDDGATPELEAFGLSIKVLEITDHQMIKAVVYVQEQPDEELAGEKQEKRSERPGRKEKTGELIDA
jgi:putative hemolysin